MNSTASPTQPHDPWIAFRHGSFWLFLMANFAVILGGQMQATSVLWEVHKRTHNYLDLGNIGLAQFLPVLAFALVGGRAADRFNRKVVLLLGICALLMSSVGLALTSLFSGPVWTVYFWLVLAGIAKAFVQPAKASFLPLIVPAAAFPNAVSWNMGAFQLATIGGPVLAGLLIEWSGNVATVYLTDAALIVCSLVGLLFVRRMNLQQRSEVVVGFFTAVKDGLLFTWNQRLLFAAITLDMLAVLFGGATALFPVFAEEILQVGPGGMGAMRAAMGLGALAMSLWLAWHPPMRRAGDRLMVAVGLFGVTTIVFALSRSYWLSLTALFVMGAVDMISVVIRHTLVQMVTPDEMRGRVSAINGIFIGASNELGAFESGATAHLMRSETDPTAGAVRSAFTGGIGTILVMLWVRWKWPELAQWGRETPGVGHRSDGSHSPTSGDQTPP